MQADDEDFDELLADLLALRPDADLQSIGRAIWRYMKDRVVMLCLLREKLNLEGTTDG